MLQDMFAAIEKATQKSDATCAKYAVVEMDHDGGRKVYVVDYEYTLSDEFEASGGDVLYVTVSH